MARILVLTDRPSDDTDWKGALSWRIILALAESHHEVMVATPLELENIPITHPRLTITRPVSSWRVDQLPLLAKTLLTYQPQIIHSFAFLPTRLWPSLSVWPYLHAVTRAIPAARRFSTLFEPGDCSTTDASFIWHQGSESTTVFSEHHKEGVAALLGGTVEVVPLDLDLQNLAAESAGEGRLLIPSAVSEWENPMGGLQHLAEFLHRHPNTSVRIVGGWGDWLQSKRKEGWQVLASAAARVSMTEALNFKRLIGELRGTDLLWLEPLRRDSWKFLLCSELAQQLNKKVFLTRPPGAVLALGSTANSLSRLYSST